MTWLRFQYFLFILLLGSHKSFADTFTVTSIANAGPGTLREAIEAANANGITTTDYIHFNIGRVREVIIQIALDDPLPPLTSNIIIDGSTQPGAALGVSGAKVTVALDGLYSDTRALYIFSLPKANDVQIYGLFLKATVYDPVNTLPPHQLYAIHLMGCSNITIGAPGKGNVISGWNKGIYSELTPQAGESENVNVKSNFFGLDVDGVSTLLTSGGRGGGLSFAATNAYGVVFEQDLDITVGGEPNAEGNIFNSLMNDIFCSGVYWYMRDSKINIINNKIGIDYNNNIIATDAGIGIWVRHFAKLRSFDRHNLGILIRKNYIAGRSRLRGIMLDSVQTYFAIENNILGGEINDLPPPGSNYGVGIHLKECDIGFIGGEKFGNENIIRYWKLGAFIAEKTSNISFRFNSTYCNKERAITIIDWEVLNTRPKPYVTVNYVNVVDGVAEGTAPPYSTVDLYMDDNCPDCEGKFHVGGMFAVILVDGSGRWNFGDGLGRGNIVATATDAFGATSEYSAPTIDSSALSVTPVVCKEGTGSICGIKIISGTVWQWEDEKGNILGTDTCLKNVPPGKYYFRLGIGPTSCEALYSFLIEDKSLGVDSSKGVAVSNTRCGKSMGSICGIKPINASSWQWEDISGTIVSTDTCLKNVTSGRYRFRASNGTCDIVTAFYTIENSSPFINSVNVQLKDASCGLKNGSITGLDITGASFSTIKWIDENGGVVGTGKDLTNIGAGKYKLIITDDGEGCGDSTSYFLINAIPPPVLNTGNASVTHATCGQNNGSITNITVGNIIGNAVFIWVDEQNKVVGNTLNLENSKPGRYRLKLKDGSACDTLTSSVLEILNNGNISIDTSAIIIRPTGCNKHNGSITGIKVTGATTWEWRDITINRIVSTSEDLINAKVGTYQLFATNVTFGCLAQSNTYTITLAQPLPLQVAQATTTHASCNENNGSIQVNQLSNNPALFTFNWLKDSTTRISASLHLSNLSPADYFLIATDSNGCEKMIYKETIIMQALPTLDDLHAIQKADTCGFKAGSITGVIASSSVGPVQYQWYSAATNSVISNLNDLTNASAGQYYLVISDKNKCTLQSKDFTIDQVVKTLPTPRYNDLTIPRHSDATVAIQNYAQGEYLLYDSATGNLLDKNTTGNFKINRIPADQTFYVTLNSGPCSSEAAKIVIKVADITQVQVPNVFSPNGDGINDVLKVTITGYFKLNGFKLFNRWGQLIFESRNLPIEWNGKYNNVSLPIGSYYWIIEGVDVHNKLLRKSGSVTIIR